MFEIDRMYTLNDVKNMTGLSERTLRRHLREGLLKGAKVGGVWRFRAENLKHYFNDKTMVENIANQASKDVKKFLRGEYSNSKDHRVCVIVDIDITEGTTLSGIRQDILDIANAHKEISMKFTKDDDKIRITLLGDFNYIEDCVDALKSRVDQKG